MVFVSLGLTSEEFCYSLDECYCALNVIRSSTTKESVPHDYIDYGSHEFGAQKRR